MKVVLVGLMGAGKSTVGQMMARETGLRCADLDVEIAALAGRSIAELFDACGEPEFRRLEARATEAMAVESDGLIVAAGGGWMANPEARAALPDALTVWLKVSPAEAARRISRGASSRPLLEGRATTDRLEAILAERLPAYGEATYTVDTEGRTAAEVSSLVMARLGLTPADREGNRTKTYEERR